MKKEIYVYVAQTKKGHFEVSIPWVAPLATPLRGPSPAQLKEELVFRLLELVHEQMHPAALDRLIPPIAPYLNNIFVEIERQVDVDRPPVTLPGVLHVIAGSWGEDEKRLWMPRVPDVTLVVSSLDQVYSTVNRWVAKYADDHMLENLDTLVSPYHAAIESISVDLGFPSILDGLAEGETHPRLAGRLTRPVVLQQVATNLSHRAEDESLQSAYGRDKLVEQIVDVITSPNPTHICLVGPSGVGKTAIIYQAVMRAWHLQASYQERRDVWQTSGDRIIAGMSILGQWEQRTEAMCRELAKRKDVLFVEELMGMIRAGRSSHGNSNVAQFIEPYLDQDQFAIITEATEETWTLARSSAPGFVDKFRRIQIPELGYRETLAVITELVREIEGHHNVRYTADAMESILDLTRRFFRNDAFPGKAVRLVKQCQYDALRFVNESEWEVLPEVLIDADAVARVVHRQTGLPSTILRPGTGRTPAQLRRQFEARVFGQPDAVTAVCALILSIEQGLSDPRKPLGSFLLIGPSGVGKTETAKAISEDLFGSTDRLIRFDMSEFSSSIAISRLIGTSRNPDGELTNRVRLQPFCVLLFDEIEKANPMVLDLLLQILGDGRLTDAAGRLVDFRNAVIIMTSNLGAGSEDRWLGFSEGSVKDRELHYLRSAEGFFRPEIFNRIDTIIPFRPLGADALRRIARRTLQGLLERRGLRQAQVMVDVDNALIEFLAKRSVDRRYGARTLAHRIERLLITPLAEKLIEQPSTHGVTRVSISPDGDKISLELVTLEMTKTVAKDHPARLLEQSLTEPDHLSQILKGLDHDLQTHLKDARFAAITQEYESALDRFNEVAEDGHWSPENAELLRLREHIINQVEQLEQRLQGLYDPRTPGEFLLTGASEEAKSRAAKFAKIVKELQQNYVWINVQLDCLANQSLGATLIFSSLSGQSGEILERWHRWMDVIEKHFQIDVVRSYHDGERWVGDATKPLRMNEFQAFAVSSITPGSHGIFIALAGFTWCPRPASEGQHSLLKASHFHEGFDNPQHLLNWLRTEHEGAPETLTSNNVIEFIETDTVLDDVRLGRKFNIPDDRAQNLTQLLASLMTARLFLGANPR